MFDDSEVPFYKTRKAIRLRKYNASKEVSFELFSSKNVKIQECKMQVLHTHTLIIQGKIFARMETKIE